MRFLKEGLVGLVVASGLALTAPALGQDANLASKGNVARVVVEKKEEGIERNYQLVREYLVRFSNEFLDDVAKESKSVRKNLEEDEGNFKKDYLFIHQLCLYLGKKSLEGKISEEDYLNATREICKRQKKYSSSVDYSDEDVVSAENKWVKERTKFLGRLLKTEGDFKTGEDIIRAAYSKREYEEYVKEQNGMAKKLYGEIGKTMNPLTIFFGGGTEVVTVRDTARNVYFDSIDEIYGK